MVQDLPGCLMTIAEGPSRPPRILAAGQRTHVQFGISSETIFFYRVNLVEKGRSNANQRKAGQIRESIKTRKGNAIFLDILVPPDVLTDNKTSRADPTYALWATANIKYHWLSMDFFIFNWETAFKEFGEVILQALYAGLNKTNYGRYGRSFDGQEELEFVSDLRLLTNKGTNSPALTRQRIFKRQ